MVVHQRQSYDSCQWRFLYETKYICSRQCDCVVCTYVTHINNSLNVDYTGNTWYGNQCSLLAHNILTAHTKPYTNVTKYYNISQLLFIP